MVFRGADRMYICTYVQLIHTYINMKTHTTRGKEKVVIMHHAVSPLIMKVHRIRSFAGSIIGHSRMVFVELPVNLAG